MSPFKSLAHGGRAVPRGQRRDHEEIIKLFANKDLMKVANDSIDYKG
jgi:hypothetical protein